MERLMLCATVMFRSMELSVAQASPIQWRGDGKQSQFERNSPLRHQICLSEPE